MSEAKRPYHVLPDHVAKKPKTASSSHTNRPPSPSHSTLSSHDDRQPKTPSSREDRQHRTLSSRDDRQQRTMSSHGDRQRQTSSSRNNEQRQTPPDDKQHRSPSSRDNIQPRGSCSNSDRKLQTPSSHNDRQPRTPSSHNNRQQRTPSSHDDRHPRTPSSNNDRQPRTLSSHDRQTVTSSSHKNEQSHKFCTVENWQREELESRGMENVWKQRGRARGRAQGTNPPAQQQQQQQGRQNVAPVPAAAAGGNGGARGGNGNGARGGNGAGARGGNGNGGNGGASAAPVSRGALRGRRQLPAEIVHTRPAHVVTKQGEGGRKVKLQANYFELSSVTDWIVTQYHVDFQPNEDLTRVRRQLLEPHYETIGGNMFDGTALYAPKRFVAPGGSIELFSERKTDNAQIKITIRHIKELAQSDYQYLQLFNIIMKKCLRGLNLQLVGRDFFDPVAKVDLYSEGMQVWPGYVTSIRQHENSIMMCAEITHKIMRTQTAHDLIKEIGIGPNMQRDFANAVIGTVVLTDYNNKTYRVDDVDFEKNPSCTFPKKDGSQISYMQYYWEKYGKRIKDQNQPLLITRMREREVRGGASEIVCLIPELCRMTGLTEAMRSNFELMKVVHQVTRIGPDKRVDKLNNFNRRLQTTKEIKKEMKDWNMSLSPHLVQFTGRVIDSQMIVLGTNAMESATEKADWTQCFRKNAMFRSVNLSNWAIVYPRRMGRETEYFVGLIRRAANGMSMQITDPQTYDIEDDKQGTYVFKLDEIVCSRNYNLIICILPKFTTDRYGAIKKKLFVDYAIPCQVLTGKALNSKNGMSIATKVAIQINCKLGGAPWTTKLPPDGLMVIGYDVSHNTASKGSSYGALVASLNTTMTTYFSTVEQHSSGEELSDHLAKQLLKAIAKYRENNQNKLPSRIFFYRDGVGDGQIGYVNSHEIEEVKKICRQVYQSEEFKLTFIIVSKRINTRIFDDRNNNPRAGTIVDDVITLPERYDFFLVSQCVKQGSVSPTSYNVIYDTSGFKPSQIQLLSYKLSHLYYNWSGTVKVPAPVQYAHKLAMLCGQTLHRQPHQGLSSTLYFL